MAKRPIPPAGEIVLYQTDDGQTRVECRFVEETLWLSQALIAELFQKDVRTINEHLQNLYTEGELDQAATIRKFRIVRREGSRRVAREVDHYNLDAILGVGYRVRSERGTQFRRWATERLREYLVKGFTLDDQRLKNPPVEGSGIPDYFDELLERIRDIRASEKRMYLRVREIFALAGDYDPDRRDTFEFLQTIQNRLHFAATGRTAPELVATRADHKKPNMGLTAWKGAVVRKADVTIAKNYLDHAEISELNRIVTMWLDFAEDQARSPGALCGALRAAGRGLPVRVSRRSTSRDLMIVRSRFVSYASKHLVEVSMRADPEPNSDGLDDPRPGIWNEHTHSTVVHVDARRVNGIGRVHLLEPQAWMTRVLGE